MAETVLLYRDELETLGLAHPSVRALLQAFGEGYDLQLRVTAAQEEGGVISINCDLLRDGAPCLTGFLPELLCHVEKAGIDKIAAGAYIARDNDGRPVPIFLAPSGDVMFRGLFSPQMRRELAFYLGCTEAEANTIAELDTSAERLEMARTFALDSTWEQRIARATEALNLL